MPTEKSKARRVVDIETPDTAIVTISGVLFSIMGGYNRRGGLCRGHPINILLCIFPPLSKVLRDLTQTLQIEIPDPCVLVQCVPWS